MILPTILVKLSDGSQCYYEKQDYYSNPPLGSVVLQTKNEEKERKPFFGMPYGLSEETLKKYIKTYMDSNPDLGNRLFFKRWEKEWKK